MEAFDRLGPESGQVEVSGLAVDRDNDMVWMSDWVDGRYLYGYDLKTGKYVRKVHLRPVPQWQQGIFMVDGRMLISADDGDADLDEPDTIYIADMRDRKSYATALPFRAMTDFLRAGEIEGLAIDPRADEVLGTVQPGFADRTREWSGLLSGVRRQTRKSVIMKGKIGKVPEGLFCWYVPDADLVAASRCLCGRISGGGGSRCLAGRRFRGWAFPVARCGASLFCCRR